MEKKVKKWGNSLVIVFDKEDVELLDIREGDWIDLPTDKLVENENEKPNGVVEPERELRPRHNAFLKRRFPQRMSKTG